MSVKEPLCCFECRCTPCRPHGPAAVPAGDGTLRKVWAHHTPAAWPAFASPEHGQYRAGLLFTIIKSHMLDTSNATIFCCSKSTMTTKFHPAYFRREICSGGNIYCTIWLFYINCERRSSISPACCGPLLSWIFVLSDVELPAFQDKKKTWLSSMS